MADRYTTSLYFEAHITIDPEFEESRLGELEKLCQAHNFHLADFKFFRNTEAKPKAFCSIRDKDFWEIGRKCKKMMNALEFTGFKVLRYKIENTLIDQKF